MVSYDPKRNEKLRVKCINLSIGRFLQTIDFVLQRHRDRGRDLDAEAAAIIREVITQIASDELQDSAVFLIDDTPPGPPKKAWGEYDQSEDTPPELRPEPKEDEKAE